MAQTSVSHLMNEAHLAQSQKRYQEAINLYSEIIQHHPNNENRIADCLNNRASCYKHIAEYKKAFDDYNTALELLKSTKTLSLWRNIILLNKSDLLMQMGLYEDAVETISSFSFDDNTNELKRLANLSAAYSYLQRYDDALLLMNRLITTENMKQDSVSYGIVLQNLGFLYGNTGNYPKAIEYFNESLPYLHGNQYYIALAGLAIAEASKHGATQEDYRNALNHIDKVLDWQSNYIGTSHPDYIISLRKRAEILLLMNHKRKALQQFKTYYKAELEYIKQNFMTMTEQQRLDFWKKEKPLISEIFSLENESPFFLYDIALLRRLIAFFGKNDATAEYIQKILSINHNSIMRALTPTDVAIEIVNYKDFISNDTIYGAVIATPQTVKFIKIGRKYDIHSHPINNTTLDYAISSEKNDKKNVINAIYTDSILAEKIWRNILTHIPAKTRNIYFAPDGIFHMLGIENLHISGLENIHIRRLSSTSQLCKKQNHENKVDSALIIGGIEYNDNTQSDNRQDSINNTAYNFIKSYLGKPLTFSYLPGTKQETDSISFITGHKNTTKAHEQVLKQTLNNYDIIHLATHGYSFLVTLEEPPTFMRDSITQDNSLLASGIALTGANVLGNSSCAEDGLLSSRELCELDLSNIKLAVISACKSSQGVVSDEGPAGIVRALKKAGVQTIIATLWSIDDKATALFMTSFYRAWKNGGKNVQEALAYAKQAVKNYSYDYEYKFSSKKKKRIKVATDKPIYPYKDPYYWAPFIIID